MGREVYGVATGIYLWSILFRHSLRSCSTQRLYMCAYIYEHFMKYEGMNLYSREYSDCL